MSIGLPFLHPRIVLPRAAISLGPFPLCEPGSRLCAVSLEGRRPERGNFSMQSRVEQVSARSTSSGRARVYGRTANRAKASPSWPLSPFTLPAPPPGPPRPPTPVANGVQSIAIGWGPWNTSA